jgi:hypothetical protein
VIKEDAYLQFADVKSTSDGLHLTVKTPFKSEICNLVLSHPIQVTALKPEAFLQEIEELSKAIYKKYLKP